MDTPTLGTERLLLRSWRDSDRESFAELNADPAVMEHLPTTLTRDQSDAFADRVRAHFDGSGWGLWAVEVAGGPDFIGFVGLWPADHLDPGMVEVGWRLSHDAWGQGFAPEAATESVRFGFEVLELEEIVSFTVPQNGNSRRVMEKIGLRHRPERDFDHPNVDPETHPELVHHVLYSLHRSDWPGRTGSDAEVPEGHGARWSGGIAPR